MTEHVTHMPTMMAVDVCCQEKFSIHIVCPQVYCETKNSMKQIAHECARWFTALNAIELLKVVVRGMTCH